MTDAMQTIRDLLVEISDWTVQPYAGARPECHFCGRIDGEHYDDCISLRAKSSLTALDSLAVAPSEDARKLGERISTIFGVSRPQVSADPGNDPALDSVAALIQARDERIRREYEEKIAMAMIDIKTIAKAEMPSAKDALAKLVADTMPMDRYYELEKFILAPEATNGR